jgi:hypothetical protein
VAVSPSFTTENALTTNALGTVGGNNLDHDFKIEYNEVWNFNVEHELTPSIVLSAASPAHKIHANFNSLSSCYSNCDWPSSCSPNRTHE